MRFIGTIYILILVGCSVDEFDKYPTDFSINLNEIGISYVAVSWTESFDPDGGLIVYDLYLDGNFIASKTGDLTYTLGNLSESTNYILVIIASNNKGLKTEADLTFMTNANLPPSDFELIKVGNTDENPINICVDWTDSSDPEGESVSYVLYLNDVVHAHSSESTWLFDYLPDKSYNAKIIAIDPNGNSNEILFSFENQYPTFKGNVSLKSQEEISEFGEKDYILILGSVEISESVTGSISDLNPLNKLVQITEGIRIQGNSTLLNLNGLENVKNNLITFPFSISSYGLLNNEFDMVISHNDKLEDISALSGITIIRDLLLEGNSELGTLEGLHNLDLIGYYDIDLDKEIHGDLVIRENGALETLSSLSNLNAVKNLSVINNGSLTTLTGLGNIEFIGTYNSTYDEWNWKTGGILEISGNNILENLDELNKIEILGKIYISDNPNLASIEGLGNVVIIEKWGDNASQDAEIIISNNEMLSNIDGLDGIVNCHTCDKIEIDGNISLLNLNGFQNLEITTGTGWYITNNTSLTDFCGIRPDAIPGGMFGIRISGNAYNPTYGDLANGDCKL